MIDIDLMKSGWQDDLDEELKSTLEDMRDHVYKAGEKTLRALKLECESIAEAFPLESRKRDMALDVAEKWHITEKQGGFWIYNNSPYASILEDGSLGEINFEPSHLLQRAVSEGGIFEKSLEG